MTVDNLYRRGVFKPLECQFCLECESINHLFFDCVVAKYVWNLFQKFSGRYIDNFAGLGCV